MKRAFLLSALLVRSLQAQTVSEQRQMRQVLENLAQAKPQAEQQIDWEHLHIARARDMPDYVSLSPPQKAAFRKAVLNTLRPHLQDLIAGPGLVLRRGDVQFQFRQTPQGLKLSGIL